MNNDNTIMIYDGCCGSSKQHLCKRRHFFILLQKQAAVCGVAFVKNSGIGKFPVPPESSIQDCIHDSTWMFTLHTYLAGTTVVSSGAF